MYNQVLLHMFLLSFLYLMNFEKDLFKLVDNSLNIDYKHFSLKAEGFLEGCDSYCLNICPLPELQAVLVALSSGELLQVMQ